MKRLKSEEMIELGLKTQVCWFEALYILLYIGASSQITIMIRRKNKWKKKG